MANWPIRYHPEAADELAEADEWYRRQDEAVAARFREEAKATIESIVATPKLWAPDRRGVRQVLLKSFQYKIVYRLISASVEIISVAHTSRRPDYWRQRLKRRD